MKINTIESANKIGLHPLEFLLHISELEKSLNFNDIWPEVDETWVKTLSAVIGYQYQNESHNDNIPKFQGSSLNLSHNAIHVLDKLFRQSKWGSASVTIEALQNITHISKHDLEEVISELRKAAFLDHDGSGRGTISLLSGKRNEIESIIHNI